MARRKRRAAKKRKVEWSKVVCLLAMLAGLLIVQECLFLMYPVSYTHLTLPTT